MGGFLHQAHQCEMRCIVSLRRGSRQCYSGWYTVYRLLLLILYKYNHFLYYSFCHFSIVNALYTHNLYHSSQSSFSQEHTLRMTRGGCFPPPYPPPATDLFPNPRQCTGMLLPATGRLQPSVKPIRCSCIPQRHSCRALIQYEECWLYGEGPSSEQQLRKWLCFPFFPAQSRWTLEKPFPLLDRMRLVTFRVMGRGGYREIQ